MTDEHWRRVPALFAACLEREPGERRTFLADVGADLVREVEALLAAHGASGPFDRLVSQMDGLRGEALAALLGEANDPEPGRKERPPAFQPGHRLGRHQIGARLGAGGKGEVYRAFDARLRREVAIKTLRQPLRQRPAALRRLEQEARAASAINHPNIVTVHDIGEDEACPYIVMELVPGSSLRDLFGQPWPVDRLLHVAVQIADGLTAAHEHGIVHGDLKPENILVSPQGVVKILDFGSARFRLDDESGGAGTPGYVSPERLRGRPMDMRADQFSFGTILYEMATGRRAFPGQTMLETLTRMLEDDPPPVSETRSDLPEPLESGIARCLSKEPAERYESTRELLDELHHARRSSFTARRTAAGSRLRRSPIPSSGARDSSAT